MDMLTEETVTVEVPSSGNDAQDKYTSDCVKQTLQMTSPSSRWWDAAVRVTMFVPYFGAERRIANLSLAHCAAAVGSVELLHKCNDPHELLEMPWRCLDDAPGGVLRPYLLRVYILWSGNYPLRVACCALETRQREAQHHALRVQQRPRNILACRFACPSVQEHGDTSAADVGFQRVHPHRLCCCGQPCGCAALAGQSAVVQEPAGSLHRSQRGRQSIQRGNVSCPPSLRVWMH